jgi:Flp pilus assembly protein TadG
MASASPNPTRLAFRRLSRALLTDNAGAALVEITLFLPVLALTAVAIINFGLYFWYEIQVQNAAQAAAQWAINDAVNMGVQSGASSSGIETAGKCANNADVNAGCSPSSPPSFFVAISVGAPTLSCGCPSSTAPFVTNAAGTGAATAWTTSCATGAACSDGSYPGTYVQVTATGTFTPFAKFGSFFPESYHPSSTATVRIQ